MSGRSEGDQHENSQKEANVLSRSKRRFREPPDEFMRSPGRDHSSVDHVEEGAKVSYRDKVMGKKIDLFSTRWRRSMLG